MTYGAVVLYYRLGERIHDTMAALMAQTVAPDRIILVDNGSRDGVLDDAESRYPSCTVLRMPTNVGYAAAMNGAAALLQDHVDGILFLTHEVIMKADCAGLLLGALEADAQTAMVGPSLGLTGTESTWSLGGVIMRSGDVRHNVHRDAVGEVEWLDGACLLVRTSAFAEVDGFDEDYFLYWEDVDISTRLRDHGRIRCVPDAIAYQSTSTTPIYYRTRNQILYWRKRRALVLVVVAVLRALARAVVKDLGGRSPAMFKARMVGVLDGFTGRLSSPPISMLREREEPASWMTHRSLSSTH